MTDLTVEVPTYTLADGRLFISDQVAREMPWVRDFIDRFPEAWVRDPDLQGWVWDRRTRH